MKNIHHTNSHAHKQRIDYFDRDDYALARYYNVWYCMARYDVIHQHQWRVEQRLPRNTHILLFPSILNPTVWFRQPFLGWKARVVLLVNHVGGLCAELYFAFISLSERGKTFTRCVSAERPPCCACYIMAVQPYEKQPLEWSHARGLFFNHRNFIVSYQYIFVCHPEFHNSHDSILKWYTSIIHFSRSSWLTWSIFYCHTILMSNDSIVWMTGPTTVSYTSIQHVCAYMYYVSM